MSTARPTRVVLAMAVVATAVGAGLASDGRANVSTRWTIRDLGTLGGPSSTAVAINARGQVAGSSKTASGDTHAFRWVNGRMKDLGTLGGRTSTAVAIDDLGEVAGQSQPKGCDGTHAFLWRAGRMIELGTLRLLLADSARDVTAEVTGSNRSGQVVGSNRLLPKCSSGYASNSSEFESAFLWTAGRLVDLAPDSVSAHASAINDRGDVVGSYTVWDENEEDADLHAFLWRRGRLIDLGLLAAGGDPSATWVGTINDRGQIVGTVRERAVLWAGATGKVLGTLGGPSSAVDIDESGTVVGASKAVGGVAHPVRWVAGVVEDLGLLPGDRSGTAVAVGAHGLVIGSSDDAAGVKHAFVWERGVMSRLPSLRARASTTAVALSVRGQIVGWATAANGQPHAVLWTKR